MFGEGETRRSQVIAAVVCLSSFSGVTYGVSSGQPAVGNRRAQLDVTVSRGDARVPDATVIAVGEGHEHVASAKTDSSGRAHLIVPSGRYRVSVVTRGHQGQTTAVRARRNVAVSLHVQVEPTDPFALVPPGMGVVSGRVVDEKGEPVPDAMVSLDDDNGAVGGTGRTTVDGSFRFNARVHPSPQGRYRTIHVSPHGHFPRDVPPIVYLPDPTSRAVSVQVREKQETTGLEVQVYTSPRFRVTVTLRDELGAVPVNATVTLVRRNATAERLVRSDGTAMLGPLPAGPATVWASADGPGGIRLAGVAALELEDRPIDDLVIKLVPAASLKGRVEFADGTQPRGAQPLLVRSAVPGHQLGGYSSNESNGRVAEDGSFTLEGLLGSRCIHLTNIPRGWRLDRIQRGDREITDEPVVFASAEDVTEVTVRLVPGDTTARRRPRCDGR